MTESEQELRAIVGPYVPATRDAERLQADLLAWHERECRARELRYGDRVKDAGCLFVHDECAAHCKMPLPEPETEQDQ